MANNYSLLIMNLGGGFVRPLPNSLKLGVFPVRMKCQLDFLPISA